MNRTPSSIGNDPAHTFRLWLKSMLPTAVGVFCFLVPVYYQGSQTIPISLMTGWVRDLFSPIELELLVAVVCISALGSCWYVWRQPDWQSRRPALYAMFESTPAWLLLRVGGAVLGLMVYFQAGPEWVWGESTGRTVFLDIGVNILFIVGLACFLMPLLTDFGFMEFVGTLLRRPFEAAFRLPGRSAIDATASFVSASNVGILITIGQYERGFYNAREAAAVATCFSVVSIPFSLVVAEVANVADYYFSWYATVIVACILCALVTVRLPPLSRMPNHYHAPAGKQLHEEAERDCSVWRWSVRQAMLRAAQAPPVTELLRNGWHQCLQILFNILGPCMSIATLTAIAIEYTPVFNWLTLPVAWLLQAMGLPEAHAAAPGFLAGFLDQFMPALIAGNIDSTLTRFVLSGLSVCQLIYMAEVGVMILRSPIPLSIAQLFTIFVLRTALVLPVFWVAGLWLLPI